MSHHAGDTLEGLPEDPKFPLWSTLALCTLFYDMDTVTQEGLPALLSPGSKNQSLNYLGSATPLVYLTHLMPRLLLLDPVIK